MDYQNIKYISDNVELEIIVSLEEETAWLTQNQIASLYGKSQGVVSRRINNIFENSELNRDASMQKMHKSGDCSNTGYRPPIYYNLDVVINVGHRVRSNKGILLKTFVNEYFSKNSSLSSNIIIYNNGDLNLAVNIAPEQETVWLNQRQIAELYETTRPNVAMHIKNILDDGELGDSVSKDFLHTAPDGKAYHTMFYNLDVILAVGFRIKSPRAVEFRKWAFTTLKKYLFKGYVVNEERTLVTQENYLSLVNRIDSMEIRQDKRMDSFDSRLSNVEEKQKHLLIEDRIFYENEIFEALVFVNQLVETAEESIILIDPYTDERTLNAFKKKGKEVSLLIVASSKQKPSQIDIETYKKEYGEVTIKIDDTNHDRFLIIDNYLFYQLGSSINYLGKRFTTIDLKTKPDFVGLIRNRAEQYL